MLASPAKSVGAALATKGRDKRLCQVQALFRLPSPVEAPSRKDTATEAQTVTA